MLLSVLALVFTTYHVVCILQAVLHRFVGHRRFLLKIFESHTNSHHAIYVGESFDLPSYCDEEASVTFTLVPVAMVVAGLGYLVLPVFLATVVCITVVATFVAHVYLHEQFHLEKSVLLKFRWFKKYKEIHRVHHEDQSRNFGVISFACDRIMGTLVVPDRESNVGD